MHSGSDLGPLALFKTYKSFTLQMEGLAKTGRRIGITSCKAMVSTK